MSKYSIFRIGRQKMLALGETRPAAIEAARRTTDLLDIYLGKTLARSQILWGRVIGATVLSILLIFGLCKVFL